MLSNLRMLRLVAPSSPARTVAAGLEAGLAGLTALQELSLSLHSSMFTVRIRRLPICWELQCHDVSAGCRPYNLNARPAEQEMKHG